MKKICMPSHSDTEQVSQCDHRVVQSDVSDSDTLIKTSVSYISLCIVLGSERSNAVLIMKAISSANQ